MQFALIKRQYHYTEESLYHTHLIPAESKAKYRVTHFFPSTADLYA